MVPENVRLEMIRLAESGVNLATIGRMFGMDRKRVEYQVRHAKPRVKTPKQPWTNKQGKCPTCGAMVYLPCYACYIRGLNGSTSAESEATAEETDSARTAAEDSVTATAAA